MSSKRPAGTRSRSNSPKRKKLTGENDTPDGNTSDSDSGGRSPAPTDATSSDVLSKDKRTGRQPTVTTDAVMEYQSDDDGPDSGPPPDPNPAAHLKAMAEGIFDDAQAAFDGLIKQQPVPADAVMAWLDATLGDPDVAVHAQAAPELFADVIWALRRLAAGDGEPDQFDAVIAKRLSGLPPTGAAAIAVHLIEAHWTRPHVIGPSLRAWIREAAGILVPEARPGIGALLLNMLWSDGDVDMICALIADGVDTSTAYELEDLDIVREGVYSYYVQPIEHLLGTYLPLVGLLHPSEGQQPGNEDDDVRRQLIHLGRLDPGGRLRVDDTENLDAGRRKVARAAAVLRALTDNPRVQVLTSYARVRQSALVREFGAHPGSIWGFETVRYPFVHAVHATEVGKQPVRMWELWAAVEDVLDEEKYRELLIDPEEAIETLVEAGLAKLDTILNDDPVDYAGIRDPNDRKAFRIAFIKQCTDYLSAVASRAPSAKFATAPIRGADPEKYISSLACKAGLWWSLQHNLPVYYCLDGVTDEAIIMFKTRKTALINQFLSDSRGTPYIEVITLAEIREILLHWDELQTIVKFSRKGEFLTAVQVEGLIEDMIIADAKAAARQVPLRAAVIEAATGSLSSANLPPLDAPPFSGLEDDVFYHVVAQLLLLLPALTADREEVLGAFLATKGAQVLFTQNILPATLPELYRQMVDQEDAEEKQRLGRLVLEQIANVPPPLSTTLTKAIAEVAELDDVLDALLGDVLDDLRADSLDDEEGQQNDEEGEESD